MKLIRQKMGDRLTPENTPLSQAAASALITELLNSPTVGGNGDKPASDAQMKMIKALLAKEKGAKQGEEVYQAFVATSPTLGQAQQLIKQLLAKKASHK
jgi:hypothetical protein